MTDDSYQLLTTQQVAEHLQLNERTVTLWLRNNRLRGYKLGKEWRVSMADLQNFIGASANRTANGWSSRPGMLSHDDDLLPDVDRPIPRHMEPDISRRAVQTTNSELNGPVAGRKS